MEKLIRKSGFCPIQQCDTFITITYVGNFPLNSVRYEKGSSECSYKELTGECDIKCPILESAPTILNP